jgi:hypothetical protein
LSWWRDDGPDCVCPRLLGDSEELVWITGRHIGTASPDVSQRSQARLVSQTLYFVRSGGSRKTEMFVPAGVGGTRYE